MVPHFCKSVAETVHRVVLAGGCRKSNRLQIRNLPASTTKDDIQQLVGAFGTVQRCDLGWCDFVFIVFRLHQQRHLHAVHQCGLFL